MFKKNMHISEDPRYGIGNWVIKNEDGTILNTSPGAFGFTPWIDYKNNFYGVIAVRCAFPKEMPVFWSALQIIEGALNR